MKCDEFFYLFICTFFHQKVRSDPSMDFHALWLKRRGITQGCAFLGFRGHCYAFLGVKSSENPNFGGVNRRIQAKRKLLKVLCYRNYCIYFNQILHNDGTHQVVIVGVVSIGVQQIQGGGLTPF